MIESKELQKPKLTFGMLQPGQMGGVLAQMAFKKIFGIENFNMFKRASIRKEYIPEEEKIRVDREVYARIAKMFGKSEEAGEQFWKDAINLSDATLNYARGILFADQDRKATLTTNVAIGESRPSSALVRLNHTPYKKRGIQCKYDQGRQLALALLCAEILSGDENGHSRKVLEEITNAFEEQLFIDSNVGDPKPYPTIFSYHTPQTNRLVGLSHEYADPKFSQDLWIKALDYDVRTMGIRSNEEPLQSVPVLFEERPKDVESTVIKALHRSLKGKLNGGLGSIETGPHSEDRVGLRFVLMNGDHCLRDKVTARLEDFLRTMGSVVDIKEDDKVNPDNGKEGRVQFRRRQVSIADLDSPIEVVVQTLPDYIAYQYEIGEFDPKLKMHNGSAHDLYKLWIVSEVAPYLWPVGVYNMKDRISKLQIASFEYATRLARKERIRPSPYPELVA